MRGFDTWERIDRELNREKLEWCTGKIWRKWAENWNEWSVMMAFRGTNEKTPELLRMDEKNSHNWKQLWEDGVKLELLIFGRTDEIWRKNSPSIFKCREWRWETPPWIVEILRDDNWKGWTDDDKNLTDLGERHLTDDNSFLRQTLKEFENNFGERRVG